jgi:hypothetical protein
MKISLDDIISRYGELTGVSDSEGTTSINASSTVNPLGKKRLEFLTGGSVNTIVGSDGQVLYVLNSNSGSVVLRNGLGNLKFEDSRDITLLENAGLWLINIKNYWYTI